MNIPSATEIEQGLIEEIAVIVGVEPATVKAHDHLHDLGIDSLGLVEILVFIEESFSLNLMDSGLKREDFQTIQSLAALVASELRR